MSAKRYMRFALSVLLLLFTGTPVVPAPARPKGVNRSPYLMGSEANLQLTTKVIEYRSCFPNELTLRLRFTFTNKGRQTIILDKRSSVVGRHFVGRDLEMLRSRRYEEESSYEGNSGPYIPEAMVVPSDMSNFIILEPNAVFEVESDWSQVHFTVNDGTPHSEAGLRYGSHYLQVQVGTWPHASDSVVKRARREWSSKGFLWSEPLISEPMQFTIDLNRSISKCQ